jgi:acyl-CoA thioester hydrolase
MSVAKYQMDVQVIAEHIDGLNHVNNVQYLYWVQEIAKAHWNKLTAPLEEMEGVWGGTQSFYRIQKTRFFR